jgi:hypothetical protein
LFSVSLMPLVMVVMFRFLEVPIQWSTKGALVGVGLAILLWSGIKLSPVAFTAANSAVRRWISVVSDESN